MTDSPVAAALIRELARCSSAQELRHTWRRTQSIRHASAVKDRLDIMEYYIERLHDLEQDDGR